MRPLWPLPEVIESQESERIDEMTPNEIKGIEIDQVELDQNGELSGLDDETLDAVSGGLAGPPETEPNPMCPNQG